MKIIKNLISRFSFLLLIISCSSPGEPEIPPLQPEPYFSLNIGDIRQFYDAEDNVYFQQTVKDTLRRIDGQKIYHITDSTFYPDNVWHGEYYWYIKDNFLIGTKKDSSFSDTPHIKRDPRNLFNEYKLARIYPTDGEIFSRTNNTYDSAYVKVTFIDSFYTFCGTFRNVYQYEFIDTGTPDFKIFPHYAPGYGPVGSIVENEFGSFKVLASYIKMGDKAIGKYRNLTPVNNYGKPKELERKTSKIFGIK